MTLGLFCITLLTAGLAVDDASNPSAALANPGFESHQAHENWSLHVYGAEPEVAIDSTIRHGGSQSLRVAATAPSDTAFGQELQLTPGRWYRLSGWVRTENLDPHGAVFATFQVQLPGGHAVVRRAAITEARPIGCVRARTSHPQATA